jgi:hypothetical protein
MFVDAMNAWCVVNQPMHMRLDVRLGYVQRIGRCGVCIVCLFLTLPRMFWVDGMFFSLCIVGSRSLGLGCS